MKNNILLLSAVIATFSFTALAGTGAQSLRTVAPASVSLPAAATETTLVYVDSSTTALLTPRALTSQSRTLKGVSTDANNTLACAKTMSGGPKAIQACTEHPATMPGCQPLAMK